MDCGVREYERWSDKMLRRIVVVIAEKHFQLKIVYALASTVYPAIF